jgi:AcrR family transcriptional regulator
MSMLGRQGARKLSVSDIYAASGVSRGTFYRCFSSKEEVLAAVNRHFENGIIAAFGAAIEVAPDPALRVQIVLNVTIEYCTTGRDLVRMLDVSPSFTLQFLRDTFPHLVDAVIDALAPVVDESPL